MQFNDIFVKKFLEIAKSVNVKALKCITITYFFTTIKGFDYFLELILPFQFSENDFCNFTT